MRKRKQVYEVKTRPRTTVSIKYNVNYVYMHNSQGIDLVVYNKGESQ